MDYAIASGERAAQTLVEARQNGADYSRAGLAGYRRRLEQGSVLQDMNTYRNAPAFLERPGFYSTYPGLMENLLADLYRVTGEPAVLARRKAWPRIRKAGVAGILADVLKGTNAV
jgi:electron transfer flavoprotein-quinone oxidoreductase